MDTRRVHKHYDFIRKVTVIGNSGAGKSSLVRRISENYFTPIQDTTIGVEYRAVTMQRDGVNFKVQFWDTAGQEKFRAIVRSYYRGSHLILFIYDVTDIFSFQSLKTWAEDVTNYVSEETIGILIGTKTDIDEKRELDRTRTVTYEQGKSFADEYNMPFIEVSSKNNSNIDELMVIIKEELFDTLTDEEKKDTDKIRLIFQDEGFAEPGCLKKGCTIM